MNAEFWWTDGVHKYHGIGNVLGVLPDAIRIRLTEVLFNGEDEFEDFQVGEDTVFEVPKEETDKWSLYSRFREIPLCVHCQEEIIPEEEIAPCSVTMHRECLMRCVIGSVGHQRGECQCHGKVDNSEEGISTREAAIRAMMEFQKTQYEKEPKPQSD